MRVGLPGRSHTCTMSCAIGLASSWRSNSMICVAYSAGMTSTTVFPGAENQLVGLAAEHVLPEIFRPHAAHCDARGDVVDQRLEEMTLSLELGPVVLQAEGQHGDEAARPREDQSGRGPGEQQVAPLLEKIVERLILCLRRRHDERVVGQ